jgi:hypothetical protein
MAVIGFQMRHVSHVAAVEIVEADMAVQTVWLY